jgi:hypothetical protein
MSPGQGSTAVSNGSGESFSQSFNELSVALFNELYPVPNVSSTFTSLNLREAYELKHGLIGPGNSALGLWGASVQAFPPPGGSISTKRGAITYLLVNTERRLVIGRVDFQAPATSGIQVAVVRIQ